MSDSSEIVARLVEDFGKIPLEFRKQVRPELKRAADSVVQDAKKRASWSSRIPGAIGVRASLSKKRQGFSIRVNQDRAPHGRPFEGIGTRGNTFRHPVFGTGDRRGAHSQDKWAEQKKRPFIWPAVRANSQSAREAVAQAVEKAARVHGWK